MANLMRRSGGDESPEIFRRATRPHQSHGMAPGSPAALRANGQPASVAEASGYLEAIKFYRQALDKDAASTDALQGIMNLYLLQKQPDQAIAARRARKSPQSASTGGFYVSWAAAAHVQNRKDLAAPKAAFRKAIELDKNKFRRASEAGRVQAAQGSVSQALAL